MPATYTRRAAAYLLKCPFNIPSAYHAAKPARHRGPDPVPPLLDFLDLMELRVWMLLSHADNHPWSVIARRSGHQATKLDTAHPLCDLRTLQEMENPPTPDTIRNHHGDHTPSDELRFQDALRHLLSALDFDGTTPVRWHAGTDLNIARGRANITVDPLVNCGAPTVSGTTVTAASVSDRITRFHERIPPTSKSDTACLRHASAVLGITQVQAETADAYALALQLTRPHALRSEPEDYFALEGDPALARRRLLHLSMTLGDDIPEYRPVHQTRGDRNT